MRILTLVALLASFIIPTTLSARTGDLTLTAGTVSSFEVTCAATATAIRAAAGESYTSIQCGNITSTIVYVGGSGVTSANGFRMCRATTCEVDLLPIDVNLHYCRTASGTQVIRCLAVKG